MTFHTTWTKTLDFINMEDKILLVLVLATLAPCFNVLTILHIRSELRGRHIAIQLLLLLSIVVFTTAFIICTIKTQTNKKVNWLQVLLTWSLFVILMEEVKTPNLTQSQYLTANSFYESRR